jgi:hypothetical protein
VCSLCISTSFSSLARWGIRAGVLVLTIFTLEISHFILTRGLHFQPLLKLQNSSVLPHLSATRLKLRFGDQSRLQRQSPAESSSIARTQQRASLEELRNATRNDPGKALLGQRCGAAQRGELRLHHLCDKHEGQLKHLLLKYQSRPKASFGEARFVVYSAQNFIGRKCELVPNQSLSACMISNHNIRPTLHIPSALADDRILFMIRLPVGWFIRLLLMHELATLQFWLFSCSPQGMVSLLQRDEGI